MAALLRAGLLLLVICVMLLAQTPPPGRVKCCHGCESYACSEKECGTKCKAGPKCQDCWKNCK